jgi:glycosyltransferase involved in cell wall biosynthesis
MTCETETRKRYQGKLRILFVLPVPFGTMGSNASYVFPLKLAELGHDVTVLSPRRVEGHDRVVLEDRNSQVRAINIEGGQSILRRAAIVSRYAKRLRPQLIHVFFRRWAFVYPIVGRRIADPSTKWVMDIRSPLLTSGWRRPFARMFGLFEQFGYDAVMTHTKPSAYSTLLTPIKPLFVVPPGVDTKVFEKLEGRHHQHQDGILKARRFVYIGAISRLRGLVELVKSFELAAKILPRGSFNVDFYGDGDAVRELNEYIRDKSLSTVVSLKGRINQSVLMDRLLDYDVGMAYVPHGSYEKAPGLKTLEYMAAGLIVIASNTEGNRLFVKQGRNGVLVPNDYYSISEVIVKAVVDGLPSKLAVTAYYDARLWDWDQIIGNELLKAYGEILAI